MGEFVEVIVGLAVGRVDGLDVGASVSIIGDAVGVSVCDVVGEVVGVVVGAFVAVVCCSWTTRSCDSRREWWKHCCKSSNISSSP